MSWSLGPFSALCWSPSPAPTAQQSGPAPWEFSLGSPLPANTGCPGTQVCPCSPPRLISWDRPPWPRPTHRGAQPDCEPPPPPAALGRSSWRHHSARQSGLLSVGAEGRRSRKEQVPRLPAWGAALLAGFHTLCTGRVPPPQQPKAPSGRRRPLAPAGGALRDRGVSKALISIPSRCFGSAFLSFWAHVASHLGPCLLSSPFQGGLRVAPRI